MPQYCVNNDAQPNGDHEVHKEGCANWPRNHTSLGDHRTCATAVVQATFYYRQSNGCYQCSRECHTD